MFSLRFTNIPANGTRTFDSLTEAYLTGRDTGFEFVISDSDGELVVSWAVFGGHKIYDPRREETITNARLIRKYHA